MFAKGPPKRVTAYQMYMRWWYDVKKEAAEGNPDTPTPTLSAKDVSNDWKALSPEEELKWTQKAAAETERRNAAYADSLRLRFRRPPPPGGQLKSSSHR